MISKAALLPGLWMSLLAGSAGCSDESASSQGVGGSSGHAGATVQAGAPGTSGSGGAAGQTSTSGAPNASGSPASAGTAGASSNGGSAGGGAGSGGAAMGGAGSGGELGGASGSGGHAGAGGRPISFGTLLDAQAVVSSARELAQSLAKPGSSSWRAKGDQHRTYRFADADQPYRLCVPSNWDGSSSLPLAMFLHGAGNDESSYLDQNNQQMIKLAQQHGYLLVSPLGVSGAYGNFLRLSAPFGDEVGAAELMAAVTPQTERANELSEQDVINVLELVLSEYPIDTKARFLFGHSMGSGGTWYIGGKYASYWRGIAPMSGPFVQEKVYPWDSVHALSLFVTEGTQAPSLDASKLLMSWLEKNDFDAKYRDVNADHPGMVPLVLPDVFDFFDATRAK